MSARGGEARNALLALDVYQDEAQLRSVLFDADQDVIQIGRQQGCDLRLDHPAVSRMHAVITVLGPDAPSAGPGLEVIDLGSAVGTRVNGKLVDRQRIAVGDVVEIALFQVQVAQRHGKPGVYPVAGAEPLPPAVG